MQHDLRGVALINKGYLCNIDRDEGPTEQKPKCKKKIHKSKVFPEREDPPGFARVFEGHGGTDEKKKKRKSIRMKRRR